MRSMLAVSAAAVLAAGCGSGGRGTDAGGAPGGPGTPGTSSGGDGTSTLDLEIDRAGARADVARVDLQVLGAAVWVGGRPAPAVGGTPCDLAGADASNAAVTLRLDLSQQGATPLARIETTRQGELTEVRLLVRGTLVHDGR